MKGVAKIGYERKGSMEGFNIPINAISLPRWWWPVIEDMPQMSVADTT
jgi:hypothetical protein